MRRKLIVENRLNTQQVISLEFDAEAYEDLDPWVQKAARQFRERYPHVPYCNKDIRLEAGNPVPNRRQQPQAYSLHPH